MTTPLVHPDLLGALAGVGFYPSSVDIQTVTETRNVDGAVLHAWADSADPTLVGIDCAVNRAYGSRAAQEIQRGDMTVTTATHVIGLAGYHPTITNTMRADVGGTFYDVLAVEHDAQSASTWLLCELVTT